MSDQKDIVPGRRRPRARDDEPTRPIIRESGPGTGQKPDRTMDLEEDEVEIIAGDEVTKGEQTRPIRIPKGPPPPPPGSSKDQ